ncbi:hypothetical protein [Phenylobacterium sp.]|uniref:hypothetical protein n=1 Tax=Phenylobacterium sp. TaxID=1871053 RepID=UPI00273184D2|nr:hypothetical protein [Phenylobacterium sp.]MDP1873679.1 hypothetical protein [Phenylobacterium sp.]
MGAPAVIQTAPGLALYERMCSAIAECVAVDEAKDIRDKALALEAYYRQARNLDAEREAANVRLRAERRVGELLKDLARADHADAGRASGLARAVNASPEDTRSISEQAMPKGPSPYASALYEHGISRQTAHKFQALANIPEADFERALKAPEKPSTKGVIARATVREPTPAPRVPDDALWLWGRLRDFERDGYFSADPSRLLRQMTDAMRADVLRLAPLVADFLNSLEAEHEPV